MKKTGMIIAAVLCVALALTGCSQTPASPVNAPVATDGDQRIFVAPSQEAQKSILVASSKGEVKQAPDTAYISVGVVSQGKKQDSVTKENANKMDAVKKALIELGISENDMTTTEFYAYPMEKYTNGVSSITGYEVRNTLEVKVSDINSLGSVIDAAMAAGANKASPSRYECSNEEELKSMAMTAAIESAKKKAEAMAAAAGVSLKGIVKISEQSSYSVDPLSNFDYYAPSARESAMDAGTSISVGSNTFSANVTIEYEIA